MARHLPRQAAVAEQFSEWCAERDQAAYEADVFDEWQQDQTFDRAMVDADDALTIDRAWCSACGGPNVQSPVPWCYVCERQVESEVYECRA